MAGGTSSAWEAVSVPLDIRGVREWFRAEAVAELISAAEARRGVSREIWGLMQFAIWHRLFIERPGLRPAPDEDPLDWISD